MEAETVETCEPVAIRWSGFTKRTRQLIKLPHSCLFMYHCHQQMAAEGLGFSQHTAVWYYECFKALGAFRKHGKYTVYTAEKYRDSCSIVHTLRCFLLVSKHLNTFHQQIILLKLPAWKWCLKRWSGFTLCGQTYVDRVVYSMGIFILFEVSVLVWIKGNLGPTAYGDTWDNSVLWLVPAVWDQPCFVSTEQYLCAQHHLHKTCFFFFWASFWPAQRTDLIPIHHLNNEVKWWLWGRPFHLKVCPNTIHTHMLTETVGCCCLCSLLSTLTMNGHDVTQI